jgi:alkylation response protein AidB-like acyl-CoA dehydrogenase
VTEPAERPRTDATAATPSFTRGLFAGAVHDSLIFPFHEPLEEIRPDEAKVVRRLIAELHRLRHERVIDSQRFDEEETIGDDVLQALARAGFLALTIPREFGGLELSTAGYARVFSEISATDGSLAVIIGVHCGLGAKAIVLFGTAEQKARYLPVLARGETLAAYALTEPNVGSDAQHIEASAEPAGDGGWILNGRKIWIGNAHKAGVIVTFAQTRLVRAGGVAPRPTAFIVRPDMQGFHVVGTVRKLGIRGSTQAELLFENVQVPADHVLGSAGKGFSVAVQVLNAGRMTLTAGCAGGMRRLLREMAAYSGRRIQFGKPLADFEITQRKLSRTAADLYATESMLGVLAGLMEREGTDYALETACAKVFASDAIWRSADELVQIAGGRGFVKPYPYEQLLRDARINRIFEGGNEVLRLFIALNGVQGPAARLKEIGAALRRPMRNLGLVTGYAASRMRSVFGATSTLDVPLHPRLMEHKRYFEKHTGELAAATERLLLRHREAIIDRQLILERLATMAIELFARAAVLSRTQAETEKAGDRDSEPLLALCDVFCIDSGRRFRSARQGLDARDEEVDDRRRAVAAAIRAAGGAYVEDPLVTSTPPGGLTASGPHQPTANG